MKLQCEKDQRTPKHCLLMLATIVISACGSSSSGPVVQQGRIVDTTVTGIGYSTASQSGVTGADGGFSYLVGETITFTVGEFEIASIPAKSTLNWFELGGLPNIPVGLTDIQALAFDNDDFDGDGVYDAPSISRVGAIASVLTTLDGDRDSSNGIVIAANVAALMTADIDLKLEYAGSARYNTDFQRIIRRAADQGLLSAREVRNGGLEVAALYQRLGVDLGYKVATRYTRDNDANGIDDWVRLLTYDTATGKVVRDEYDTNGDGLINDVFTQSYDAELYGEIYTTDRGNDGIESTRVWEKDVFGDVIRHETTQNGALFQLETRELDPLTGLYIRREVINPVRGTHTIETWTMDSQGNRPIATIDNDGDGTPEVTVTLSYDEPNGPWTYREDDTDGDGSANIITTRIFNGNVDPIVLTRDDNADGTIDHREERDFDSNGIERRYAIDSNNDGFFESETFRDVNSRGQTVSSSREENGVLVFADVATYNSVGRRLTYSVDRDGDGSFDDSLFTSYNSDNRISEYRSDSGADGVIDLIRTYTYGSDGRLIERQDDNNADGIINRRYVYTYDIDGYPLSTESWRNGVLQSLSYQMDYVLTSIAAYL